MTRDGYNLEWEDQFYATHKENLGWKSFEGKDAQILAKASIRNLWKGADLTSVGFKDLLERSRMLAMSYGCRNL